MNDFKIMLCTFGGLAVVMILFGGTACGLAVLVKKARIDEAWLTIPVVVFAFLALACFMAMNLVGKDKAYQAQLREEKK